METDWCNWFAEGLVENGCQYLSIALMEGADHVQELALHAADRLKFPLQADQTISEKIGYEVALAYSYGKKRSAFITHGFSLPVAMDPLMSSIYTGVAGGFVVITLDMDLSLPYSSRCDPVSLAMFAKMPVIELSDFRLLSGTMKQAFNLSERFETPVMLHIDTKVPKGTHNPGGKTGKKRRTKFEKNPTRWAATPRFRFLLHKKLNLRLKEISEYGIKGQVLQINGKEDKLGIICNHANLSFIKPWAERHQIPVLSIQMPFPLPVTPVSRFIRDHKKTVIIEDRFPTIQFQLPERTRVLGRITDPKLRQAFSWQGDALIQRLEEIRTGKTKKGKVPLPRQPSPTNRVPSQSLAHFLGDLKGKEPSLVLVADRTPLTAGLPVDHFVSRGGAISIAAGYMHAQKPNASPHILGVTDSYAFLHYGMQATTNAVFNTASVKCLVMVRPEHENTLHTFLKAMDHVEVVPLNPKSKNARKKLMGNSSQPVTIFTVQTGETA